MLKNNNAEIIKMVIELELILNSITTKYNEIKIVKTKTRKNLVMQYLFTSKIKEFFKECLFKNM